MDIPRQRTQTLWQRFVLLRTGAYAGAGTAVAAVVAVPIVRYFASALSGIARLPIAQGDTLALMLQGSTFVFAYLWLAFYMLERAEQQRQIVHSLDAERR